MHLAEWIMIGLIGGGLGLGTLASKNGWMGSTKDVSKSARSGSASGGGRYYRGGK